MSKRGHGTMGPGAHGTEEEQAKQQQDRPRNGAEWRQERERTELLHLRVEQVGQKRADAHKTWLITWAITNIGKAPIAMRDVHVPHGKFRGQKSDLSWMEPLASGMQQEIHLPVTFNEEPGTSVENAFLILTVVRRGKVWRVFVRMTVRADSAGAPLAHTELITAQEVGFSKEHA